MIRAFLKPVTDSGNACRLLKVDRLGWQILNLGCIGLVGGCASGTPTLPIPFDASGRGLNSPYQEQSPQISGRYVVFSSDRRGSQDIYLFDIVEQRLLDLSGLNRPDFMASEPAISANGQWIVFVGSRDEQTDIFVYDRSSRQIQIVTANLRAQVRRPSISANGEIIAFQASQRGQWDILVYNRFGQPLNLDFLPR
jgi:beta propeller repeat protein